MRLGQELLGLGGDGMANALEPLQGQAQAGLAIAAGGFIDRLCRVEAKEGLNLPDHFPAGAAGIEDLIEKAPEGAPERVNALAAVGAFVGLRQKSRRDESGEEFFEQQKALLAQGLEAPAEGGQAGAPGWEERRMVHMTSNYTCQKLDVQLKLIAVKTPASALAALQRQYQRLRQSLAQIGYLSQGSVLDRSTLRPRRTGYQWTRKVAGKTITVALSPEQFQGFKKAVENERRLRKTIEEMEKISRQILFGTLPDTRRRNRLSKKVLGLN